VQHWLQIGRGRPTVLFAVDIAHSLKIRDAFRAAGVRAEHADANTPSDARDALWQELISGTVEVVCSVGIVSFGFDCPPVSCAILARPTASVTLYLQQVGRVLRPAPGKDYALILDHAGNTMEHGAIDEPRNWTLKDGYKPKKGEAGSDGPGTYTCKKCLRIYGIAMEKCPDCGEPRTKTAREIEQVDGQLTEIATSKYFKCPHCQKRGKLDPGQDYTVPCPQCGVRALRELTAPEPVMTPEQITERREEYFRLVDQARRGGFDLKRANVQYLSKFKVYPPEKWRKEAAQRDAFAGLGEEVA